MEGDLSWRVLLIRWRRAAMMPALGLRGLFGRLMRAIMLRQLHRLRRRGRLLAWLGLLGPSHSMSLQRNLCCTSCTGHKITVHVFVDRNIRRWLGN